MKNKILAVLVALVGLGSLAVVPGASASATRATPHSTSRATPHGTSCPSGTTAVGDYCTCPSGTNASDYCTTCPSGTNVSDYCTCPAGTNVSDYCTTCPSGTTSGDYCSNCPPGSNGSDYCTTCPPGSTAAGDYCECPSGNGKGQYCEDILSQGAPTVLREHIWGVRYATWAGPALKFTLKAGINGAPGLKSFTCQLPDGLKFAGLRDLVMSGRNVQSDSISRSGVLTVKLKRAVGSYLVYIKNSSILESDSLQSSLMAHKSEKLPFHVTVTDASGRNTSLAFKVRPSS